MQPYCTSLPPTIILPLTHRCLVFVWVVLCAACDNTRYLQGDQTLHNATTISIKDPEHSNRSQVTALKTALLALARPIPNSRIGPFQFRLSIYNYPKQFDAAYDDIRFKPMKRVVGWLGNQAKDTTNLFLNNVTGFIKNKLGEAPVVVDTIALHRSATAMHNYLFDKGYYDNAVGYNLKTSDWLTTVNYNVALNDKPFTLDTIFLPSDTLGPVAQRIKGIQAATLLQRGDPFDASKLQAEADRIAGFLRNAGYYDFAGKYLNFQLDSTRNTRSVKLYMSLRKSPETGVHTAYKIRNIYLYADYTSPKDKSAYSDTLLYEGYHYIYNKTVSIKPQTLIEYLQLSPDMFYSARRHEKAMNSLQELGIFKFVNVRFEKTDSALLDCHIYMTPGKKKQISAETELSNRTGGYIGTALKLGYKQRNTFRGAETLGSSLFGGIDFTPNDSVLINTLNFSAEATFTTPKFMVPFKPPRISHEFRPHTNIAIKAALQRRVGFYTINSYSVNYGFDWYESRRKRHILNPISVNLVSIADISTGFQELLDQNAFLRQSFASQFIIGINYSFIYSTQSPNPLQSFTYFRGNAETAGNLTSGIDRLSRLISGNSQALEVFGTPYAQFARIEADFRRYHILGPKTSFVGRFYGGIGVPYGNSDILPYPKQFFTGGPNSVRAFQIRSIGPGSDSTFLQAAGTFDRTGDMKLELNAEYRFNIFSVFKGAAFIDMGNVWTVVRPAEPSDDLKRFNFGDFWGELGLGAGLGLRLDFSYFVLRFDVATPLHNPSRPKGKRWLWNDFDVKDSKWRQQNFLLNLAIGYPF